MKKLLSVFVLIIALSACGGNSESNTSTETTDTSSLTNPISIDTVKHPAGTVNQNVISTDTAAMNTQNAINKAKEAEQKHQ